MFLEIPPNSQENTYARVSFSIKLQDSGLQLYLKRDSAQVFSCEFCGISQNTFFTEHFGMTERWRLVIMQMINLILTGDKLSIKFHKLGKWYSKKSKSILVHLDYDLPKNNRILDIGKKKTPNKFFRSLHHPKLIYQHSNLLWKRFSLNNFLWKSIYLLPRKVTIDVYLRSFQYRILHIIPKQRTTYLLFIKYTAMFFLQNRRRKNTHIKDIWNQVEASFTDCLQFPFLALKNIDNEWYFSKLLLSKLYLCKTRKYRFLSFNNFLNEISNINNLGKGMRIRINVEDLERNGTE